MKVADNLDGHKFSDKLEFRQYRTINFGVNVRLCPGHSLCNFYPIFMKLADK